LLPVEQKPPPKMFLARSAPIDLDPFSFRRVNVPGEGLMCGAYSVQGLIWTHHSIRVSVSSIAEAFIAMMVPAPGLPIQTENFDFGVIRDFCARFLDMKVLLRTPYGDVLWPAAPPLSLEGILFHGGGLDVGHYDYFGLPVSQEAQVLDWSEALLLLARVTQPSTLVEGDLLDLF